MWSPRINNSLFWQRHNLTYNGRGPNKQVARGQRAHRGLLHLLRDPGGFLHAPGRSHPLRHRLHRGAPQRGGRELRAIHPVRPQESRGAHHAGLRAALHLRGVHLLRPHPLFGHPREQEEVEEGPQVQREGQRRASIHDPRRQQENAQRRLEGVAADLKTICSSLRLVVILKSE
ncbi:hypothetical protein NPIL_20021 [Nephila pilipes]|uniref:Uncharacterized protein n=1 Tax=Nephila pilipes TaxID=299642 RepID=A0A8X6PLG7_NEPPI|nr:hypothetical protein NPIL_20021 [Nephila pilipes]